MFGQPLVDKRIIRRQQIENIAVFMHDAAEEKFNLAP